MDMIVEYLFCCKYTTNNKIIDLLEDLATRKVKCNLTAKLDQYGENYHQLYLDVLKNFKDVCTSTTQQDGTVIKNWSSIRKKNLKDLILKNFIIEVKYRYGFDDQTTENLKRDINMRLNFKTIGDKTIIIKNNKIKKIVGLNLTTNNYSWDES
ncbi:hypothetical protein MIV050L [Invertebrate iridescent virus 3]|uniref:Uncharacterized protein 050L n=1 Tax=Invertebrate iridescent virus 3 TaxID=345201 RepID=VF145_IIV3|nr:hypothetical protein MIV050L [Invertebrate iridescent virus 3]Q197B0.1 RecName: Full=Uncharacterized protein 050L [Invertebrate iridescent virus 3]ABF82080.1 hypothetical protein MIV050L [Invertebrate iridescent virus 3]